MTEKEREVLIMIAIGGMGSGKSYVTAETVKAYIKQHPTRKVLIFTPNVTDINQYYKNYKSVEFDIMDVMANKKLDQKNGTKTLTKSHKNIQSIKPGELRYVFPNDKFGSPMSDDMKLETFILLCETFKNGLLLLDDVAGYTQSFAKDEVVSKFKQIRHISQDRIMHIQSVISMRPTLWESVSVVRMHHENITLKKVMDKTQEHSLLFCISKIMIENEYVAGNIRFYVYINLVSKKILKGQKTITLEMFVKAAKTYMFGYLKSEISAMANEIAMIENKTKSNIQHTNAAHVRWITSNLGLVNLKLTPENTAEYTQKINTILKQKD